EDVAEDGNGLGAFDHAADPRQRLMQGRLFKGELHSPAKASCADERCARASSSAPAKAERSSGARPTIWAMASRRSSSLVSAASAASVDVLSTLEEKSSSWSGTSSAAAKADSPHFVVHAAAAV